MKLRFGPPIPSGTSLSDALEMQREQEFSSLEKTYGAQVATWLRENLSPTASIEDIHDNINRASIAVFPEYYAGMRAASEEPIVLSQEIMDALDS